MEQSDLSDLLEEKKESKRAKKMTFWVLNVLFTLMTYVNVWHAATVPGPGFFGVANTVFLFVFSVLAFTIGIEETLILKNPDLTLLGGLKIFAAIATVVFIATVRL
ncbi:hypothetical protein A2473_00450 [candidate division WWE3 bacterium RIFOXYC2_FULL_42_13]|uniref:Uncharacterized protein n=1 Tax=candidate division WWE3 bacterium TaxID=2053526 RepID=A0A3D0ZSU2_UNCKA|nr:MAG: hypothetical protein A2245_03215 [candidate division WWE3 bacterium RIFOXYA2_FULL_43_12]OGC65559.1 MAG: hypothetical protein A2274_01635 [candidate division WWE3 bacterium RIFOXYA12_FULL_43_11]OGC73882.1 MAG: hypothetical protein A2337_00425 [candidate division WWE3 bacterium RIFOXYB2_FULL_43_9]OGC74109.1 MAG: hypothetical protein A2473_00450 [candidate division WWE3 bacterium RIFOXYC2_FULL_42_13]OGC74947.1 MAG: hypothetical protein A2547_00755 [candidate division WWE3 bacterium RIFOXYD